MEELTQEQFRILDHLTLRRAGKEDLRLPIPPRSELGLILHRYPGRQPIGEVFPPLTRRESLAFMVLIFLVTATGCLLAWSVMRLVIEVCLWMSRPGGAL